MLRNLKRLVLTTLFATFASQASAMFIQPDWLDPTESGVGTNRYAYSGNDPINNIDAGGNECIGLNGGSGFCRRATLYQHFQVKFSGTTDFFGAASQTTRMLAAVEIPGSGFSISGDAKGFLREVSGQLEALNVQTALSIEDGSLSHPNLDGYLVNLEQTHVQAALDNLRTTNPSQHQKVMKEINDLLNARGLDRILGSVYGSDRAYQGILDQVRDDLGSDIDFSNQEHREAIGHKLIDTLDEIRESRAEGWSGCDAAGCTWND